MEYVIVFVQIFFELLTLSIIVRILLSWFRPMKGHGRLTRFIIDITQPILNMAAKITPRVGMFDFSPIVAYIGLQLIERLIIFILTGY